MRQLEGLGVRAEDSSRRDLVKVAQYFVLGYFRRVPAVISPSANSDPDRDLLGYPRGGCHRK